MVIQGTAPSQDDVCRIYFTQFGTLQLRLKQVLIYQWS